MRAHRTALPVVLLFLSLLLALSALAAEEYSPPYIPGCLMHHQTEDTRCTVCNEEAGWVLNEDTGLCAGGTDSRADLASPQRSTLPMLIATTATVAALTTLF